MGIAWLRDRGAHPPGRNRRLVCDLASDQSTRRRIATARTLYGANGILLLIFRLVFVLRAIRGEIVWQTGDPWFGLGLYLFAVGEFIHYFVVKIVRSDRDRAARNPRQQSRFRRELAR